MPFSSIGLRNPKSGEWKPTFYFRKGLRGKCIRPLIEAILLGVVRGERPKFEGSRLPTSRTKRRDCRIQTKFDRKGPTKRVFGIIEKEMSEPYGRCP
jgi:hypothetical protein